MRPGGFPGHAGAAPGRAFDLVLFDLDGTLVETAPEIVRPRDGRDAARAFRRDDVLARRTPTGPKEIRFRME